MSGGVEGHAGEQARRIVYSHPTGEGVVQTHRAGLPETTMECARNRHPNAQAGVESGPLTSTGTPDTQDVESSPDNAEGK